jgi:hypothetical protein
MRLLYPGVRLRCRVRDHLVAFYERYQHADLEAALKLWADFYKLPPPNIALPKKIPFKFGVTYDDGHLRIIHPEHFKRIKKAKVPITAATWARVVLHELYHYLFWVNDEHQADQYAGRFVSGINGGKK